jgi:hypothetical protein
MRSTTFIFHSVILAACPVAGLPGCLADAEVRDPAIDDCPARAYHVVAVDVPISASDVLAVGFDLDGDGVRDNWLGVANAVLHAWSPAWDVAPVLATRLATDVEWVLDVRACTAPGLAEVRLGAADDEAVEPARGERATGGAPLTGGTFRVPLGALGDALGGAPVGWATAPMAQVRIDALDDARVGATVGVAIRQADLIEHVAPNLAAYFTARLAQDDSELALEADADGDRVVTVDELLASPAAQVLLAPDLEDRAELGGDGLSLGFRIHAEVRR